MPILRHKSNNSRRNHCFFHREKCSDVTSTYSYQCMMHFPRLPITLPQVLPTFTSSRWNDEDDSDLLPKRSVRNIHQPLHRRIPKRYSDIVGPSSTTKLCLARKDSVVICKNKPILLLSQPTTNIPRRHSSKPIDNTSPYLNSNKKKSREKQNYHPRKHTDILAHRMQIAMSSELMHSLDRNFVFGTRKQSINHLLMTRSHSFNICASWDEKSNQDFYHHLIPRVKLINLNKEDYNEEIIIRTIPNEKDVNEEPVVDYDDSQPATQCNSNLDGSSSFIIPPPLSDGNDEQIKVTFRCRTIADKLSSDHKLVLKDDKESSSPEPIPSKPHYLHVSKDFKLRKPSSSLSRSQSSYSSLSQLNDQAIELNMSKTKPTITNERSSSPTVLENDDEHRSSSSKIYHDYKKRASLTNIPTTTDVRHSRIVHPMHTHIGLRSSTSSSTTNEKLTDMTLSSKQMNVSVINQLNEHLSTRFRQQQQQKQQGSCSNNNTDHLSYDAPPEHKLENNNNMQSNVYDEPNDVLVEKPICSTSIPPPPPPLPVGGFPPIIPPSKRLSNPPRRSTITLSREVTKGDKPGSASASIISSNLSDGRILRELRENPLFTRAQQHLSLDPGSNGRRSGRRLIGSTSNLTNIGSTTTTYEPVSYLQLQHFSKTSINKPSESILPKQLEPITMPPDELNTIIGKRTKSSNDINQRKTIRSTTKSFLETQCRQSELELIFQKRAQRSEQNLS